MSVNQQQADLKQLEKRLSQQLTKAQTELKQLCQQQFACEKDAFLAAERMNRKLPLHQLVDTKVVEILGQQRRGRPRKNAVVTKHYQLCTTLAPKQTAINIEVQRAGKFLLATNVLDSQGRCCINNLRTPAPSSPQQLVFYFIAIGLTQLNHAIQCRTFEK